MPTHCLIRMLSLVMTITFSTMTLYGQNCQSIQDFEGFPVGPISAAPSTAPGLYGAFGNPIIVEENCTPSGSKALRLQALDLTNPNGGDGVIYTMTGGFGSGQQFVPTKDYDMSFSKAISAASIGTNGTDYLNTTMTIAFTNSLSICSGTCEVIMSKDISTLSSTCESWDVGTFSPSQAWDHILVYIETDDMSGLASLFVLIDDLCIEEAINCTASFQLENSGCGEVFITENNQGATGLQYRVSEPGIPPYVLTSPLPFPITFTTNGNHSISLEGFCNGVLTVFQTESFVVDGTNVPVYQACPSATVSVRAPSASPCIVDYVIPDLQPFDADNDILLETCTIDGIVVTGASTPLSAGLHTVSCSVVDICGNSSVCTYQVSVSCLSLGSCIDQGRYTPGSLSPPMNSDGAGLYTGTGQARITTEYCPLSTGGLGLELTANTPDLQGDVVLLKPTAVDGGDPIFMAGQQYAINLEKMVSITTSGSIESDYSDTRMVVALTNEVDCNGPGCLTIANKSIGSELNNDGACAPWDRMTFTPSEDYAYMAIYIETTPIGSAGDLNIVINELCVGPVEGCSDSNGLDLGDLSDPPTMSMKGIYRGYGQPEVVVGDDCTDDMMMKSIRLKASTPSVRGDAIVVVPGGDNTEEPRYKMGRTYEYSFSKLLSSINTGDVAMDFSNTTITVSLTDELDGCANGNCQQLMSKLETQALASGNCSDWPSLSFQPNRDYLYMIIELETTPTGSIDDLYVNVDDICVSQVASMNCEATFTHFNIVCDSVKFISTATDAVSWQFEFFGPARIRSVSNDTACIKFPTAGTYQVQLSITCADGTFDRSVIETITIDPIDTIPPVLVDCPIDQSIFGTEDPDCSTWYTPVFDVSDDSGTYSYNVQVNGTFVPQGDSIFLGPGSHQVVAIFSDRCGNETNCSYMVTVGCRPLYDCTDFDDEDAGGWYRYNKILRDPRNVSLGYILSTRAISLQSSGPSGLPSDIFMKADDYSGSTWLINEVDYDGSWKTYIDNCLCFDFNVIDDGDSSGRPRNAAPYFLLTSSFDRTQPIMFGTNPVHAIRWRSTVTTTEREGWNQFCIEVDSCTGSTLPTVNDGVWEFITGSPTDCTGFNDILCDVETVMFGLDLTGSPTEEYGFDNICTGPCPPEPQPCALDIVADTLSQENGSCCYELDMTLNASWYYVDFDLTTPGVIFNTAMIDTTAFVLDTLSNGTKLRVTGKTPGFGGNLPVSSLDFMKFCFANVDSSGQTPQCVVASAFGPGPVDNIELICRDTLKFACPAPSTDPDSCATLSLNTTCDPDDPQRYDLTVVVNNRTANIARRVNLTSQDPNVRFLPIGAPAGAIPQPSISLIIPGGLPPSSTSTALMATLVTTSAITSTTSWCVEAHLLTDGMCCTAPDYFCTDLDVCCDPCDEKTIEVTDISGLPSGQVLNYGASDDGDWSFVQVGGGPDVVGPTLSITTFDNTTVSNGETSHAFINFDFLADLCEGAVVTSARLKLYADINTSGHSASTVDNNCILLQRVFAGWDERAMTTTIPNVSGINVSFLDSPSFAYEDYDLDVTTLVNDIITSGGYGFAMIPQCTDKSITLNFASKDHPNLALHPQLIITLDDTNCPEPSLNGACCHAVDVTNDCPTDFFSAVELKSITPGVNIGSHSTGGTAPQDWNVSSATPNCITWSHNSGYIPTGTTADLIQFCLDDIDLTETPQEAILNWYAIDGNGDSYIACTDTLRFECEPPVDDPCVSIIETELKGSSCDSLDCYETPWCVQWLRDTITAQTGLPEILSYNTVEKGYWNGQVVFIATNPTPPGAANIGNTDIYLCNGQLIQKCEITLFGEVCNPNLGIIPSVDISSKMLVWQTGDVVAALDPDCAGSTSGQGTLDVCMTFKNTSQHYADQLIIYPISAGLSYWPNPISLGPTGSNTCDTSSVTFQLFGSTVNPGDTVKFAVRLADTQNPDDWCCYESDTVCIVVPQCPMMNDCCTSQDTFNNLVAQGLQVIEDSCSITVCANQFDTCHYFPNASPDWGDGSIILPTVTQSDPPNNCWSYTYTTPGSYVITLPVWEGSIDEPCWSDAMSYEFTCETTSNQCDSLSITNGPASNLDSTCCSTFTIRNQDGGNTYKGIVIRTSPPVQISQVQGLNGFLVNQLSPYRAEVLHPTGNIPLGSQDVFTLCTADYGLTPHNISVHWLQQVGNDCVEVCPTDLPMQCSNDDELKCFEFVQDSVHCESETYCFQVKNTSNPSFDIASVILYGTTGGTLSPSSIAIPNGPLLVGDTSAWICVNYSSATAGDTICYSIAAENAILAGQSNICCTDTIVQCFEVPSCPMMDDCCASQDTFNNLVAQGLQVIEDSCSITICANQFDTCHYFPNASPDWGDGSIILPTVTQSDPPNNCWSYTYTTPGSYVITLPVWEGGIDDPCWSDNLSYEFTCETTLPATCAGCPNGATQGPNLVINGDFEAGNTGFTSGYTYLNTGILAVGNYSVRTSTTLDNTSWAASDRTTGSGLFLTVDGVPGLPFWQNMVTTVPGQNYALCLFYDHLVNPGLFDAGSADLEILIDGTVVTTTSVNQLPDGWQNITVNYTAVNTVTDIELQLAATSTGFQDIAIDDISFNTCGAVIVDPCCDITEEDFCDRFDIGVNYGLNGCELCLPFVLDSCDYLHVDYGDGTRISLQGGGLTSCYTYPGPSGSYTISVDYFRLDSNQDTCLRKTTSFDIITSCPPASSSCLSVADGNLDCEDGAYCFRVTNNSSDTMRSLAFIELTPSIALSPDPYRLLTPLAPGGTSEEVCLTYIGAFQGDTVCFNVVGHREDITLGQDPIICCQDTTPICFVVDCPVVPSSCLSIVADSIDCSSQSYCIQVVNNTFFDINSIAFHNMSLGHSLSPDPLGIPTLLPGDTSSWICMTYIGAVSGDSVCYNIVGHEQDLSRGQEPIFCCSDNTTYCFDVLCDPDDCCDISMSYIDSLIDQGSNVIIDQCSLTLPFSRDTCPEVVIDFGDGNIWQSMGTDTVTHIYSNDGTYDVGISIQYYDQNGSLCIEATDTVQIVIDDCGMGRICQLDDLQVYNALTPNDDGLNDELVIEGSLVCVTSIKIYNRWGQLVYRDNSYQNDWKGTSLSGEQLAEGTYFLIVDIVESDGTIAESQQTFIDIRK